MYLTEVLFSHIIAKLVVAFALSWRSFKHSIWRKTSCYMCSPCEQLFPLCHCCRNGDLPAVQTVVWMVQQYPVKQLQQLLLSMCALWDCIVVLQDHTSWQIFELLKERLRGYCFYKNKRWKWLFVNGCKWKSLISTGKGFLNLCQDEKKKGSMCWGIILKNCDTWAKYISHFQCGSDMSLIPVTGEPCLLNSPSLNTNKFCHQGGKTC